jgi:hypothetical protein
MSDLNELFKAAAEAKRKAKEEQENTPAGQALKAVQERLKANNDIGEMMEVFIEKKQPVKEIIKEVIIEKEVVVNKDSFQQPKPQPVDPNIQGIQKKLQFLEQAIGRIAATGPGSGEVNFRWLDDVDRASIDKDRQLMYDPATKKFLFVDTRVSIEAFDRSATIPLLATPQLLKPSNFINSKNLTYDAATGVFTFLRQCEVTLSLTVNALASASGQRVYQYAERNSGSGWVLIENSGKNYQLTNGQHTQIVNAQTISRQAGEQIRYFIYASEVGKVNLITETLPNVTGTVYVPAIRIQYAGR